MKPEVVADFQCEIGEAPLWHPDEHRLYWLDIPRGRIFRYDPETGDSEMCHEGPGIGGFTIQQDGALLLFTSAGAIQTWKQGEIRTIMKERPGEDFAFNDVIADPLGRVFAGVKKGRDCQGRYYRLDTNATLHKIETGLLEPNGFGFTLDRKHLYATDSNRRERYIYDYDRDSGKISDRRVFVRTPDDLGVPDGMTVDAEGYVWSAQWGGGCVIRYSPDGIEERRVELPVCKVSSVTFGGDDYMDIYITTAGGNKKAEEGSDAGALFKVNLSIKGLPEFRSRVGL